MISLSLEGISNAFLFEYPHELSCDKYTLMRTIEQEIQGIIVIDIIGQDHLARTISYGDE